MATLPDNIFQAVQTYQESSLAYLQNLNCFVSTANTKFKDFQNKVANLGSSVGFDLPPRYATANSLVATFQGSEQRIHTLTVDKAKNVSADYSNQEQIFNLDSMGYMDKFGFAAVKQLSATVEADVARSTIIPHTYRFFGDGVTPINSYGQISKMLALYRNYGSPDGKTRVYLEDLAIPDIINTGLNQFVPDRNEKIAHSWMLGDYDGASFCRSNLLPVHDAGTVGNVGTTLTVVSTNDPTGANITQITFSGAIASDADAIKQGDLLQFQDGVAGQDNIRYLTFIGHERSANTVQMNALADASSDCAGNVTINLTKPLQSTFGRDQNLTSNILAGMQVKSIPSHRAGLVVGGNALYLAMPRLPDEHPYATHAESDKDTGVSLRMYYGSLFGQNQRGMVTDAIWGSTLVDEYAMRIIFPL